MIQALIVIILLALNVSSMQAKEKKYHETCFLTSHNSYAAWEYGYLYAQQKWNITHQLEHGVRCLMLDTYDINNQVLLCHDSKLLTEIISLDRDPVPLLTELITLKKFLEKNPKEIVTIILENYVSDDQLLDSTFAYLNDYILRPSDWDPVKKGGWPALSWMQKHNKRVVIFNSISATELTYNEWEHVIENQYGTLSPQKACQERAQSKRYDGYTRYLYLCNYFPTFKINLSDSYALVNSKQLTQYITYMKRGLGGSCCKNRAPNFIALDFVDEGNGMKWVDFFNKKKNRKLFSTPHC